MVLLLSDVALTDTMSPSKTHVALMLLMALQWHGCTKVRLQKTHSDHHRTALS